MPYDAATPLFDETQVTAKTLPPVFGSDREQSGPWRFLSLFRPSSWAPLCPELLHEIEMGLSRRK